MCIGLNYADHAEETGNPFPDHPVLSMKATSAIIGPYDTVSMPRGSTSTDWELELGVVIGKAAKYVSKEDALNYVAGYCICNDVSERHFQNNLTGTWTKGKILRHLRPDGAMAGDQGRDCRCAEPVYVARRERQAHADGEYQDDDLHRG